MKHLQRRTFWSVLGVSLAAACGADPAPAPPANLTLAQVSNIVVPWEDGTSITLHEGKATVSAGGASADNYRLLDDYASGDLNGDGRPDAAVVLVDQGPGSGTFYYLLTVLNEAKGPVVLAPALIGDRVPIQKISIDHGALHLTYLNRSEDNAMTEVNEMAETSWTLVNGVLKQSDQTLRPLLSVPLPPPNPTSIPLIGVSSGAKATLDLKSDLTQSYTVEAKAGDALEVALVNPPLGVFVAVHDASGYLTPSTDRITSWSGTLPRSGRWTVDVANLGGDVSNLALSVRVSGPPPPPVPAAPSSAPPVTSSDKVAYLTFDDGPNPPYTQQMLALLAKYHAHATFFVLGENAQRYPALISQEVAGGHLVGNHTWNHASLAGMSKRGFDAEVLPTKDLLGARGSSYMRPPYGAVDPYTSRYAAEDGYRLQLWDIDPRDWARPGVASIVNNILTHIRSHAVILMHDGGGDRTQSVAALDQILAQLTGSGWQFIVLDGHQR